MGSKENPFAKALRDLKNKYKDPNSEEDEGETPYSRFVQAQLDLACDTKEIPGCSKDANGNAVTKERPGCSEDVNGNAVRKEINLNGETAPVSKLAGSDVNGNVIEEKKTFEVRQYQVELIEAAFRENLILCLPTGSGKTFIALEVTKRMLGQNCRAGKKVIFLANTVPLVHQQTEFFRQNLPVGCAVRALVGDLGVDFYNKQDWNTILSSTDVLVMSTKLLVNALLHGNISWRQICLLILDECHHAKGNHSMAEVMDSYKEAKINDLEVPRVMGLTATIVLGAGSLLKIEREIYDLEQRICCRAVTHPNFEEILRFSTSANVHLCRLISPKYSTNDYACGFVKELIDLIDMLPVSDVNVKPVDVGHASFKQSHQLFKRKTPVLLKVKKLLEDLLELYVELGPYCASIAAHLKSIPVQKYIDEFKNKPNKDDQDDVILNMLYCARTYLFDFRGRIREMAGKRDLFHPDLIQKFNSEKIDMTLKLIRQKRPESLSEGDEPLCGLLFCEKRITAQVLNWFFRDLAEICPEFRFLKTNFILGGNTGNGLDIEEARKAAKWQTTVLNDFRLKNINLIIATSVLEEGIDVASCNTVIRFDTIQTYPSYIQSMGRARMKNAKYYVLIPTADSSQVAKINEFQAINSRLSSVLAKKLDKFEEESELSLSNHDIPTFCPGGTVNSPKLPETAVVEAVYRYCSLQSGGDKSVSSVVSWCEEIAGGFKGYVLLPCNTPLRDVIEGDVMSTKRLAKRSAFRKVCELLYEVGELDDYLLPRKRADEVFENEFLNKLAEESEERKERSTGKLGSKQNAELYKKDMPLMSVATPIRPLQPLCLYQVELTFQPYDVKASPSADYRYDFKHHPYTYGFLTTSDFILLPEFSLQVPPGRITVRLIKYKDWLLLEEEKLGTVMLFQRFMAQYVHGALPLDKLEQNDENELFIVPIKKSESGLNKPGIDWEKMVELENFSCKTYFKGRTSIDKQFQFKKESFDDAMVAPLYRPRVPGEPDMFCVTEISKNKNALSQFKSKYGETFAEHYLNRWNVQLEKPGFPLLICKAVGAQRNFLKCERDTRGTRTGTVFEFPPELMTILPVPASLLLQGKYLLSILHRISRLMTAVFIQHDVAFNYRWAVTRNGTDKEIHDGLNGSSVSNTEPGDWDEDVNKELAAKLNEVVKISESDKIHYGLDYVNPRFHTDGDIYEAVRRKNAVREEFGFSRKAIHNRQRKKHPERGEYRDVTAGLIKPGSVNFPSFDAETNFSVNKGPDAFSVMEAITLINGNDYLNLERMEVMGDAVLKLVVSTHIFSKFPNWKEGKMTCLRTRLISNEHLCAVARRHRIGNILAGGIFRYDEVAPPGFKFQKSNQVILAITDDQFKPVKPIDPPTHRTVSDKSIADCTEALIGAYYLNGGLDCAMRLTQWLGLEGPLPDKMKSSLYSRRVSFAPPESEFNYSSGNQRPDHLVPYLKDLEETLAYSFKNKWLLVEALTHATYMRNRVTQSYQRLEFIGDAVIDFLITNYIINYTKIKDPGRVTDLRSALVNNVTFGCLSDRYNFHRHLLHASEKLHHDISSFTLFQQKHNHEIIDPYMLITDEESHLPQNVDIPKALGDLFESITGAIYVDSKFSLDIVWGVVYRLMKREIDAFSQRIPINPVRKVMEMFPDKVKIEDITTEGTDLKCIQITVTGPKQMSARGVGTRKKFAKEAAAKSIIREITSKQ